MKSFFIPFLFFGFLPVNNNLANICLSFNCISHFFYFLSFVFVSRRILANQSMGEMCMQRNERDKEPPIIGSAKNGKT